MTHARIWLTAWCLCAFAPTSWALYQCTLPDGRVSFQQAPCREGQALELEATEAHGVRQRVKNRSTPATPPSSKAVVTHERHAVTPTPQPGGDKTIHIGPRGGRYTIDPSGRKRYLPSAAEPQVGTAHQQAAQMPTLARDSGIHVGARGGCYTIGSTGRKNYLPRDRCPASAVPAGSKSRQ